MVVYPDICFKGLRKTATDLSEDYQSPGWDLNPGPPKYEAGVLTTGPRLSLRVRALSLSKAERPVF
jgi:hypothetical protein